MKRLNRAGARKDTKKRERTRNRSQPIPKIRKVFRLRKVDTKEILGKEGGFRVFREGAAEGKGFRGPS